MIKRNFYAGPLAAALMAKHFAVRFYVDRHGNDDRREIVPVQPLNTELGPASPEERNYVLPGSLHLLEPREACGSHITEYGGFGELAYSEDGERSFIGFS